jgi:hypothetical protein
MIDDVPDAAASEVEDGKQQDRNESDHYEYFYPARSAGV